MVSLMNVDHGLVVVALHKGVSGQMTWLEDPPPCLALHIALLRYNGVNRK